MIRIVGPDIEILNLIINGMELYRVDPEDGEALQSAIEDLGLA